MHRNKLTPLLQNDHNCKPGAEYEGCGVASGGAASHDSTNPVIL